MARRPTPFGTAKDFQAIVTRYTSGSDEHAAIVGRNGTGKTMAGAWLLGLNNLRAKPWFILDYKGEELLNAVPRIRPVDFNDMPEEPGLYILHASPSPRDQESVEDWFWKIAEGENRGLFIDEGYMLPQLRKGGFSTILTQGRAKRNSVITLSQRPVNVDRTAFSESSHLLAFDLNDDRDIRTIQESSPKDFFDDDLQEYWFRWYSVKRDLRWHVQPVPEAGELIEKINSQLEPKKRWF